MKNRSPKFAFLLLLISSLIVFVYINFCPSVGTPSLDSNTLITTAKESLRLPEIDAAVSVIKAIISFVTPG